MKEFYPTGQMTCGETVETQSSRAEHWASAIALALLLAVSSAIPAGLLVHVVGVSDGDTITVLDSFRNQYKVRLAGIDAPEKSCFNSLIGSRRGAPCRARSEQVVSPAAVNDWLRGVLRPHTNGQNRPVAILLHSRRSLIATYQ